MKKLSLLLLALPFFLFSCSSDDDNELDKIEPTQDYTSFVVECGNPNVLTNCIAAYFTEEGICKKVADIGSIEQGVFTKEFKLPSDTITRVYIYTHTLQPLRVKDPFILEKNKKNRITAFTEQEKIISYNPENKNEYPQ